MRIRVEKPISNDGSGGESGSKMGADTKKRTGLLGEWEPSRGLSLNKP